MSVLAMDSELELNPEQYVHFKANDRVMLLTY